ncbi:hypothetical protein ACWD3Z_03000 [Streptomyces sp. NPDC002740]
MRPDGQAHVRWARIHPVEAHSTRLTEHRPLLLHGDGTIETDAGPVERERRRAADLATCRPGDLATCRALSR